MRPKDREATLILLVTRIALVLAKWLDVMITVHFKDSWTWPRTCSSFLTTLKRRYEMMLPLMGSRECYIAEWSAIKILDHKVPTSAEDSSSVCRMQVIWRKPCLRPPPSPLPRFRVAEDPPFVYTGVEFDGPLFRSYVTAKIGSYLVSGSCHLSWYPAPLEDPSFHFMQHNAKQYLPRRGVEWVLTIERAPW